MTRDIHKIKNIEQLTRNELVAFFVSLSRDIKYPYIMKLSKILSHITYTTLIQFPLLPVQIPISFDKHDV